MRHLWTKFRKKNWQISKKKGSHGPMGNLRPVWEHVPCTHAQNFAQHNNMCNYKHGYLLSLPHSMLKLSWISQHASKVHTVQYMYDYYCMLTSHISILTLKTNIRWQLPWMVPHHPLDCHPPSKIWLPAFQNMVTYFPNNGPEWSPGWSNTIPRKVTNHPKDCHAPTQGRQPTIIRMVTHCPMIWLHTIPMVVTKQQ